MASEIDVATKASSGRPRLRRSIARWAALGITIPVLLGAYFVVIDVGSYEECVAEEMRGRERNQIGLVQDSCRKKYPALPSFRSRSKTGNLFCTLADDAFSFDLKIDSGAIRFGAQSLVVKFRDKDFAKAINENLALSPDWVQGSGIVINFEHGLGSFFDARDEKRQVNFSCRESAR